MIAFEWRTLYVVVVWVCMCAPAAAPRPSSLDKGICQWHQSRPQSIATCLASAAVGRIVVDGLRSAKQVCDWMLAQTCCGPQDIEVCESNGSSSSQLLIARGQI